MTTTSNSTTQDHISFTIIDNLMEALTAGELMAAPWNATDDLCDCVYQRIGMWKNPYLATTHEIRLCCVWAKLGEQYPQFVRDLPGYHDDNANEWVTDPWAWDGEGPMPRSIWYRQLAAKEGKPLSEIRATYDGQEPPAGVPVPDSSPVIAQLNIIQLQAMKSVMAEAQGKVDVMWREVASQLGLDPELFLKLDLDTGEVRA